MQNTNIITFFFKENLTPQPFVKGPVSLKIITQIKSYLNIWQNLQNLCRKIQNAAQKYMLDNKNLTQET